MAAGGHLAKVIDVGVASLLPTDDPADLDSGSVEVIRRKAHPARPTWPNARP